MTNTDKVIIGGAITMLVAAGTIAYLTNRCKDVTADVVDRLEKVQSTLNQCNEELIVGNREIRDAGYILRKLVQTEAGKNANTTPKK